MFFVLVADDWTAYLCWIPLVGAAVLPVIIWISSWVLYGFGELVENATNNQKTAPVAQKSTPVMAKPAAHAPQQDVSERIRNLQNLRAQGLITEEEFQQALTKN